VEAVAAPWKSRRVDLQGTGRGLAGNRGRRGLFRLPRECRGSIPGSPYHFPGQSDRPVNLLALRLQWFESTPAQSFPRAALEPPEPIGGDSAQISMATHGSRLESRLRALKPSIVVGGFYLGSTMLLRPIAFTCLGWLAFLIPPFLEHGDKYALRNRAILTAAITIGYRWPTWARSAVLPSDKNDRN